MATYIFSGKVVPERANVGFPPKRVNITVKDAGLSGEATVSVGSSQVSVRLDTADTDVTPATMKNYVEYLVRTLVDSYGYLSGRGYDIEISSVVDPNGQQTVFGVGVRELEKCSDDRPVSFDEILSIMSKSPYLHRALGDLREAIRSPFDTGFFGYRAIECVRQSFKKIGDGDNDKPSWERLRQSLRIHRSWIDAIKDFADPQRHGDSSYISEEKRIQIMHHAWNVIDRFCIYLSKNSQPLPESDFAELK